MTKELPLTRGKVALVDDDMFEYLNQWKWFYQSKGYAARNSRIDTKRITILLHRVVINAPDEMQVDHINGNRLDNRKENLRLCTNWQNTANHKMYSHNVTGYAGVGFLKRARYKKWIARIVVHGKLIYLGSYTTPKDAALAYNEAALKYRGEFASLNRL